MRKSQDFWSYKGKDNTDFFGYMICFIFLLCAFGFSHITQENDIKAIRDDLEGLNQTSWLCTEWDFIEKVERVERGCSGAWAYYSESKGEDQSGACLGYNGIPYWHFYNESVCVRETLTRIP